MHIVEGVIMIENLKGGENKRFFKTNGEKKVYAQRERLLRKTMKDEGRPHTLEITIYV